jgi:uncharacterized membrane protein YhhN
MKKVTLYLVILVFVSELIAVTLNLSTLNFAVKPLIMIFLATYYLVSANQRNTLFLIAMLFCWIGDVLLLFTPELFFMGGLAAFLTGHVLYILCYQQMRSDASPNILLGPQKVRFALPIVLAGTGLVVVLYPVLGDLKIPVMIYALVITIMVLQALFRFGYTTNKSFALIFVGAILFMISDSLLAINKFLNAHSVCFFVYHGNLYGCSIFNCRRGYGSPRSEIKKQPRILSCFFVKELLIQFKLHLPYFSTSG